MTEMILLVVMAVAAVGMVIYSLMPRSKQEQRTTLARRMSGKTAAEDDRVIRDQARESVAARMLQKVAPLAMRPVMPKSSAEMSKLRLKLAAAGFRKDTAPTIFLASKTVLGVALCIAVTVYALNAGSEIQRVIGFALFGAAIGFMMPNLWLGLNMKQRGDRIRDGLPDALDLLVITVESGLALDGAMQRVGDELRHVHIDLSEEFQIATREIQMGIPRSEALNNIAERTQLTEIKSLVAVVTQAEKFGTSVARALRNQADAIRVKRRQRAEERAQKTAVKLMAPLILFIFPAIFVVLVGPAALRMIELSKTNSTLF